MSPVTPKPPTTCKAPVVVLVALVPLLTYTTPGNVTNCALFTDNAMLPAPSDNIILLLLVAIVLPLLPPITTLLPPLVIELPAP